MSFQTPKSSVVLLSGGLDSTTLLAKLAAENRRLIALSIDYGQRHKREIEAAKEICKTLGVELRIVDLTTLKNVFGSNSLTDDSVPVFEGNYDPESIKTSVVPARNLIFIAIATALAISEKCETIAYAAHGGDHEIYPDCRPEFAEKLDAVVQISAWHNVRLERPFVALSKTEIVRLGNALSAPLSKTWSCYNGGEKHCGKCSTCLERKSAFAAANVQDPTIYAE